MVHLQPELRRDGLSEIRAIQYAHVLSRTHSGKKYETKIFAETLSRLAARLTLFPWRSP